MIIKPIIRGLLTYVPLIERRIGKATGGTNSARYCYSVWLRHLVMAHENGLDTRPRRVAELGPGDSIGIGLAALLTGASEYNAFDLVSYASDDENLTVFDALVELFRSRAPIPDAAEFPHVRPYLASYEYPENVLDTARMTECLHETRLSAIRDALSGDNSDMVSIRYRAPWFDADVMEPGVIDMVFSQAVLEHVDDLNTAYAALTHWLKPSGIASHQISFTAHGLTPEWNGHWTIPRSVWKLIRGKRAYLLNREPASTHTHLIRHTGLDVVAERRVLARSEISRDRLVEPFSGMSEEDLTTQGLFVQAVKPGE